MTTNNLPSPSPQQLAEEARRILEENPMTSREHWEFLIEKGIIDRDGTVLVCRLFREDEADQADKTPASALPTNGSVKQPMQPQPAQEP